MGWETRGKRRYYYRKVRKDGRVTSQYVGKTAKLKTPIEPTEEDNNDQIIIAMLAAAQLLLEANLIAAGYRNVHGHWRKKRG